MVENEENIQKASSSIHSQNHRNSMKVEFDGLSVVDEETDDNMTVNADSVGENVESKPEPSDMKEFGKTSNERMNVVISPYVDAPVVTRRKDGVCCRPHELQVLREIQGSGVWRKSFYTAEDECQNCPKTICRDTRYPGNHLFPRLQCRSQILECPSDNNDFMFQSGTPARIGYAYSSLGGGKRVSTYTSDSNLVGNCFMPNPMYNMNSPIEEMTLSECYHVHGGPDFFISGACPVDMARPQFPVGGNLEQLLQEVHDGNRRSLLEMNKGHKEVDELHPTPRTNLEVSTSSPDPAVITTPTVSVTDTTVSAAPEAVATTDENKGSAENIISSILPQMETLKVGERRSEDDARKDRFRSQLNIQLHIPENQTSTEAIPTIEILSKETKLLNQSSDLCSAQTQNFPNLGDKYKDGVNHNTNSNSNFGSKKQTPSFTEDIALQQRKLYKLPLEQGYQDFIASNPEISRTKPVLLSKSVQNLNTSLPPTNTAPDGVNFNWRSNAYGRIQCINRQQNIRKKTDEQAQNTSNLLLPGCKENTTKVLPELPQCGNELPVNAEQCTSRRHSINHSPEDHSNSTKCVVLETENPLKLHTNLSTPSHETPTAEPHSIPPSPASAHGQSASRLGSVVHLRGDQHGNESNHSLMADRSQKSVNYHNMYGSEGDNTKETFSNIRRNSTMYPHRKMSVIVGDTQQGCFSSVENSRSSSSGHDSPTKIDKRRRVLGTYMNHQRRYGTASRPDFGIASNNNNLLMRSVSLDPTKHRLATTPTDGCVSTAECLARERTNSVSSRTSSVVGHSHTVKGKISQSNIGEGSASSPDKSVPWCACWGNGCI